MSQSILDIHADILRKERFKKCWLEDRSGYWMEKSWSTILGKVTISVDDRFITTEIDDSLYKQHPTSAKKLNALLSGIKALPYKSVKKRK